MNRRSAKFVLLALSVALVAGAVFAWDTLYWSVMTRREPFDSGNARLKHPYRGWKSIHRWSGEAHGWERVWYTDTGMVCWEVEYRHGQAIQETHYYSDGTVCLQAASGSRTSSPPWRWGITRQKSPSAPPWILDDRRWARALSARGE